MKKAVFITALTIFAMIEGRVAASESRMPQKFNVGGYIQVPGSSNHELKALVEPIPRFYATDEEIVDSANGKAIRAATGYLKKFIGA